MPVVQVFSIFKSIQGESTMQGFSCGFVRLAGCPFSCSYCDTRAACESEGRPMGVSDVLDCVRDLGVSMVEVTGGEPLAQQDTALLLSALANHFKEVLLETSGGFSIEDVDTRVRIILDVKCPDSKMAHTFLSKNLALSSHRIHELKFVISSRRDFEWALDFCRINDLFQRDVIFSPAMGKISPSCLAEWVMGTDERVRLQLQLHKLIWPDAEEER